MWDVLHWDVKRILHEQGTEESANTDRTQKRSTLIHRTEHVHMTAAAC